MGEGGRAAAKLLHLSSASAARAAATRAIGTRNGEHGGEPSSVDFCHRIGLDYVSCSPYRVPLARLAAAQAALKEARRGEYVQAGG